MSQVYSSLISKNFKRSAVYRGSVVSSVLSAIVVLIAQAEVWKALYAGQAL